MSRFVKHEINSPQMRSVVVLILCTYFWIYLRPPDAQILHLLGGPVSLLGGGRAPPGVWVIPTLPGMTPNRGMGFLSNYFDLLLYI